MSTTRVYKGLVYSKILSLNHSYKVLFKYCSKLNKLIVYTARIKRTYIKYLKLIT